MERAAFLLVRLLSIFLGGWVVIQLADVLPSGPFSGGRRLIPHAIAFAGAVALWIGSASVARKISLDAYRWLPLEDEESDEPWLRQIPISVESILAAAFIVAGTVFAVHGIVLLASTTIDIVSPFDVLARSRFSVVQRFQALLGQLVGSTFLVMIGLFLVFRVQAIVAPIRRLGTWHALDEEDDGESRPTWEER